MKLSIIIPAYNSEIEIIKCLNSCLKQSFSDYEVIIVNDGSTDNTLSVIEEYSKKHSGIIRVLDQVNKRQGAARNFGLSIAKGEYVWFVDSDDFISENCLSDLCEQLSGVDILYCDRFKRIINGRVKEVVNEFDPNNLKFDFFWPVSPCLYILRRNFLNENNIRFLEYIYFEDNEYIPKIFSKVKKISVYSKSIYNYVLHQDSTTQKINIEKCIDLISVSESIIKMYINSDSEVEKIFFLKYIYAVINMSLHFSACLNLVNRIKFYKYFKKKDGLIFFLNENASIGLKVKLALLNYPSIIYVILKLERLILF